jgi:S1-C subfamily serine protease
MPLNLETYKAVVRITYTSNLGNRSCTGSGVVISPAGLVITNNHVIEDPDFGTAFGEITIESLKSVDSPATDAAMAEVVIRNEQYDLAILRMRPDGVKRFIDLLTPGGIDSSLMERRVRILGYPPIGGPMITVTRGVVSGFDLDGNLKTDAEINPGNSGGAALDEMDAFLGIPSFIVPDANGKLGFVITLDRIRTWFEEILRLGIPKNLEELAPAFAIENLNFGGDNVDRSNSLPQWRPSFRSADLKRCSRKLTTSSSSVHVVRLHTTIRAMRFLD